MARSAEYGAVLQFLDALGLKPEVIESIHIDNSFITVVGFEYIEGGKSKVISGGEPMRFSKQFPMHATEEK